jgi:hypothetical protein
VGEGTAEARRREVELTREALAEDVERFARKVRAELDWKARLRREGPQIAAVAGAVIVVVVGGLVLRRAVGKKGDGGAEEGIMSLDELTREVRALREELGGRRKRGTSGAPQPLWQKVAVRAATAGAAAGASLLARRLSRQAPQASDPVEPTS